MSIGLIRLHAPLKLRVILLSLQALYWQQKLLKEVICCFPQADVVRVHSNTTLHGMAKGRVCCCAATAARLQAL